MTASDPKSELHHYLRQAREALLWKLEGLSPYDLRRPMTPTGTNLLGLVKHLAAIEYAYFGPVFGRPFDDQIADIDDDDESNTDMWAKPEESVDDIVELYRRAWAHADATIDTFGLSDTGRVPWWPDDRAEASLHRILIHVIAETDRHLGHADIVRELIDGAAGMRDGNANMPPEDQVWWQEYWNQLERVAREAGEGSGDAPGA